MKSQVFLRSIKKLDYQSAEMTRSLFLQLFCMDTLFSHCLFYAMAYTIIRFLFQVFFKEVLVFSFSYIKIIRPFLCKRTAI